MCPWERRIGALQECARAHSQAIHKYHRRKLRSAERQAAPAITSVHHLRCYHVSGSLPTAQPAPSAGTGGPEHDRYLRTHTPSLLPSIRGVTDLSAPMHGYTMATTAPRQGRYFPSPQALNAGMRRASCDTRSSSRRRTDGYLLDRTDGPECSPARSRNTGTTSA